MIFSPNSKPIDFVFDLGGLVSSERTTSPTGLFIYQPLRPTVYRQATVCVDENKNKVGLLQLATLIRFQSIGVAVDEPTTRADQLPNSKKINGIVYIETKPITEGHAQPGIKSE